MVLQLELHTNYALGAIAMSDHNTSHAPEAHTADAVENVVPLIPVVLPVVGAIMIFLLAFIAVNMA
ncbi:hypothetical protein CBP36_00520 [Acidovorax carolinensis]|uniref:Uncharacterized protein n=1 Tax=Acidovorax carolinensis TaxID=553814 RepID=A0A240U928_9BURK|nr:hypothetical protein CBP36_00520 [Acidovorax carolinensis]